MKTEYEQLVAELPQTVFVEALHLLSPSYFIEPYKELHSLMHPYTARLKRCALIRVLYDDLCTTLSVIIRKRRDAGRRISLAEYTHLLDCARSVGDGLMAEYIWNAMGKDNVKPDLRCYNHFLQAKIWNGCYNGKEQYRLRVTPYAYRKRRTGRSGGWDNFGTGKLSLTREVLRLYEELVTAGHEPDETTIRSLVEANARVGNVERMKEILKDIWSVDVDAVKQGESSPVRALDRASPLYPTTHLLKTIGHAFATNSDIPGAISVISHFATSYGLEVTEQVWLEIIKGSFVLSKRRSGPFKEAALRGQVSYRYIRHLYDTMTSAPFNVQPSFDMHWYFAKAAWTATDGANLAIHQNHAYKILEETRRKRHVARGIVESYLPESRDQRMSRDTLRSRGFAEAVRTYDIARLRYIQQTSIMERLTRLQSRPRHVPGSGMSADHFSNIFVPYLLEEWRDYLPGHFTYQTWTGKVEILGATAWGESSRLPNHDKVQARNDLKDFAVFERTSDTVDDDFNWAKYRDRMWENEFDHPLIQLLLGPEVEETDLEAMEVPRQEVTPKKGRSRLKPIFTEPFHAPDFKERITQVEKETRIAKEIMFEHAYGYFRFPELAII
ncbi:mitochondrial ATPase expression-domain-containing protein [Aspergillus heterothallicus]